MELFRVTASQIFIMLVFILIGWMLRKFNVLPESSGSVMGRLLVWVFTPARILKSLTADFTVGNLSGKLGILIAGAAVVVVCFLISKPLGELFGNDAYSKNIYRYSFVIPNTSYVGVPLALAVFGEKMCSDMIVFTIPYLLLMYTWGMYVLTNQEGISFRSMNNPVMYSIVAGILLGLLGVKIPEVPAAVLTDAGDCIAPCAMLLAGFVVGGKPLAVSFCRLKGYAAALVRLVVLPLIIAVPMLLLRIDREVAFIAVLTTALPIGLNSVVFPEATGQDSSEAVGMVIISTVLSIVTVPLTAMLLMKL